MDPWPGDPMQVAAERTIEAAAAALLWCGPDSRGVLAHIAGRSAWMMASARSVQISVVEAHPETFGECYDDQAVKLAVEFPDFDLAAMPAWAAREWAAQVRAATAEAQHEIGRLTDAYEPRVYGLLAQDRVLREKVKLAALQTIALWGNDPLNLEHIEAAASAVTTEGIEVPAKWISE
jgi:hypothetical protein